MTSTQAKILPPATETFSICVPAGTRQRLEDFRYEYGLPSRNQAVYELICSGLLAAETKPT